MSNFQVQFSQFLRIFNQIFYFMENSSKSIEIEIRTTKLHNSYRLSWNWGHFWRKWLIFFFKFWVLRAGTFDNPNQRGSNWSQKKAMTFANPPIGTRIAEIRRFLPKKPHFCNHFALFTRLFSIVLTPSLARRAKEGKKERATTPAAGLTELKDCESVNTTKPRISNNINQSINQSINQWTIIIKRT